MQSNNSTNPTAGKAATAPASDHEAQHRFGVDLETIDDATEPFDVRGMSAATAHAFISDDDTGQWVTASATTVTIQESNDGERWTNTEHVITDEGKTTIIDCRAIAYLRGRVTDDQSGTAGKAVIAFHADESDPTTPAAVRGTSFPASPVDGQEFFRTDLGVVFWWDKARASWLGVPMFMSFGRNAAISNGESLRTEFASVQPLSAGTRGWELAWNITVTAVTGQWFTSDTTGDIDLDGDSTTYGNFAFVAVRDMSAVDLNLKLTKGEVMRVVFNFSVGSPTNPAIGVEFRRRET